MKKIIIIVGLLVSSSVMVSAVTYEKTKIADVLIYNGSGVWNNGITAFEQFLAWKGLTSFTCDDVYIESNDLVGNFEVIFFPGGDFTQYDNDINSTGLQHIRDFISAGGGYLGICGGGYFACDRVTWRGQPLDMSLDLFFGTGYGPIEEIAPWLDYTMTTISMNISHPINQYEPSTESIVYYGGAAFYPFEAQNIEMIGTYDEYNNDISILDFQYGSGRVLLCGPHPEIEEDSARDDVTFADELFDLGTDWNILWTGMDWLMNLPISEPPPPLPPHKPELDGPANGNTGTEYFYTITAEDPEEDELYYWVDWGDETNSDWVGPYNSGEEITLGHIWNKKGTYSIQCKAKDMIGGESNWSDPLDVSMPIKNNHILPQKTSFRDILFNVKLSILLRIFRFPSFSACVIDGDEVTWSNGYGYYDLENKKTTTPTTIYNVGSISKTITGTALMQLWEQELFDLDEDVNTYLPFNLRNPHFPDDPITFRMLLTHSSSLNYESGIDGVKYYGWLNFSEDPPFEGYPNPFLEEHLTPGGKWYYSERWSNTNCPGALSVYSNCNFDIIAYLVELISGEPFLEYCDHHIFQPLQMYNTSFNLSKLDIEHTAIPYHYHNHEYLQINELSYLLGEFTPPNKYWRVHMYPVGGLYTTVMDLSHFLIAHMNGGVWNGIRILEEETIEEMHRIQPPGNIEADLQYYGLAWIIFKDPLIFNLTMSGFSGDTFGVSTWMAYIPSEDIAAIYFSNGDRQNEKHPLLGSLSMIFLLQQLFKKADYNLFTHIKLGC